MGRLSLTFTFHPPVDGFNIHSPSRGAFTPSLSCKTSGNIWELTGLQQPVVLINVRH